MDSVLYNVYCPLCKNRLGRDKLLFKTTSDTRGKIRIMCRGCKQEIEIDLGKEPLSR